MELRALLLSMFLVKNEHPALQSLRSLRLTISHFS